MIEIFSDLLTDFLGFLILPGSLYFLIGVFYHYFRNNKFWNVLFESIIIGFLLGYGMPPEYSVMGLSGWILSCIFVVFAGGVLAFKIRGSSSSKLSEIEAEEIIDKTEKYENIEYNILKSNKDEPENRFENIKMLFQSKLKEPEQKIDIEAIIQQLNDNRWQRRYKAIISLINIGDSTAIDDVRKLLDDENHTVQETAATYLRSNNAFPKTRPEEIELYPYKIKKPYTRIKRISTYSDYSLDSKNAKIDDIDSKLREESANLGANAIIQVNYIHNIFKRNKILKGQGIAVLIKDLENVEKAQDSGWVFFYWGLFCILQAITHELLILIPVAIFPIIYGFFVRWGYKNKTYLLSFLFMVIVSAAIWVDNILKNGFQYPDFYIITSIFLIITIIFVYEYLKRKENTNLPWKDQWGFN